MKSSFWELWFQAYPKEKILNDGTSGSVIGFFFKKGKFSGISHIPSYDKSLLSLLLARN